MLGVEKTNIFVQLWVGFVGFTWMIVTNIDRFVFEFGFSATNGERKVSHNVNNLIYLLTWAKLGFILWPTQVACFCFCLLRFCLP